MNFCIVFKLAKVNKKQRFILQHAIIFLPFLHRGNNHSFPESLLVWGQSLVFVALKKLVSHGLFVAAAQEVWWISELPAQIIKNLSFSKYSSIYLYFWNIWWNPWQSILHCLFHILERKLFFKKKHKINHTSFARCWSVCFCVSSKLCASVCLAFSRRTQTSR